jgi:hypothetical protein
MRPGYRVRGYSAGVVVGRGRDYARPDNRQKREKTSATEPFDLATSFLPRW